MKGEIANRELTKNKSVSSRQVAVVAMVIAATACTFLVAGCSTPSKSPGASPHARAFVPRVDRRYVRPKVKNGVLIMPFFSHVFGSSCYDTLKCRVLYQNRYDTDQDRPSGSFTETIRGNLSGGWMLNNLPSVARVSWTSRDGVTHDEEIDLGKVFRTRLVQYAPDLNVYNVNLRVYNVPPDVILVVEDRSVRAYMRADITFIRPEWSDNKYRGWRSDLVIAYSHEF